MLRGLVKLNGFDRVGKIVTESTLFNDETHVLMLTLMVIKRSMTWKLAITFGANMMFDNFVDFQSGFIDGFVFAVVAFANHLVRVGQGNSSRSISFG